MHEGQTGSQASLILHLGPTRECRECDHIRVGVAKNSNPRSPIRPAHTSRKQIHRRTEICALVRIIAFFDSLGILLLRFDATNQALGG
jgi:hypothetical protein